jgi:DnaJ-class molecular chaperone
VGSRKRVTMPDGGALDLVVPEGVTDGQVLRLKGKGGAGHRSGEPGDALVEIKVRPHPEFRRIDDDIHVELPVTIDEAILGARIEVPTITGRVQFVLPKGTSSGKAFRIKGKGVNNATTGRQGDEIVTIKIILPERIDGSLSYFMSEWHKKNGYRVR